MRYYLDTSAAVKVVINEEQSHALRAAVDDILDGGGELFSSWLLHTELHCAATRRTQMSVPHVATLLQEITLVDLNRDLMIRAAEARWGLRAADAIHVGTALALQCDAVITYDREMLGLLASIGVRTLSPGR